MKRKGTYTGVIVALCFVMVFTCLGFCSSTKGLYVSPVTEALGISRSVFSLNDSCRYIATAVVNIFFGALVAKFGTRKLIAAGFAALICSSLCYSFASNVVVFYLGGVFLGLGLAWTTTTMVGCVVNKWCREKKGTVMGAVLAANGLGGALATQIVTPIIYQEGDSFAYRDAYRLVAVILLVVGTVVVLFFRENPRETSTSPAAVSGKKGRGQSWSGISCARAAKMPYFYLVCVCIFFSGLILQGITGVAAAHMKDVGISAGYLATVMSVHSLTLAGFKFLTGALYDRFGLKITANTCSVAAVAVMFLLAMVTDSVSGRILAMVYGIFSSLALPLETIMLPIYAADLFGEHSFDKIMGIFVSVNTAGYALGAPIMNLCYDLLGSYRVALYVCAAVMTGVVGLLQFVLREGKRQRLLAEKSGISVG